MHHLFLKFPLPYYILLLIFFNIFLTEYFELKKLVKYNGTYIILLRTFIKNIFDIIKNIFYIWFNKYF